jgi:hypothetical protein
MVRPLETFSDILGHTNIVATREPEPGDAIARYPGSAPAIFALTFGQPAAHGGRVAQPLWHVPDRQFGPRVVPFAEKRGTIPSSVYPPFRAG